MMPVRVQQRRTRGWRKPENTVSVARPSKFGNPFAIGHTFKVVDSGGVITDYSQWRSVFIRDSAEAVARYAEWVEGRIRIVSFHWRPTRADIRQHLAGRNLMCFCPLDQPCHADVLLELANGDPA